MKVVLSAAKVPSRISIPVGEEFQEGIQADVDSGLCEAGRDSYQQILAYEQKRVNNMNFLNCAGGNIKERKVMSSIEVFNP